MHEWQIDSMLLALHNIAKGIGSLCVIAMVFFFMKDMGK